MAKIVSVDARPILDSRDEWTLEVEIVLDSGEVGTGSAPSGKSKGSREAAVVSATEAVHNVHGILKKAFVGLVVDDQKKVDRRLCEIDGTINKAKLGGNTTLAFSIAALKVAAAARRRPPWAIIRELSNTKKGQPRLFVNVINGGLHAGNNLAFQEYLIIPKTDAYFEAADISSKIYHKLREILSKEKGAEATNIGDEGGFAPDFEDNLEPYEYIKRAAKEAGLENKIDLGMDAAAGAGKLANVELKILYKYAFTKHGLLYLEDPFDENNFEDFTEILSQAPKDAIIAGDDLTTTNARQIKKAVEKKAINGVIVKPNQIGTVSEAIEAVEEARRQKIAVVVSHRSGETNDDFIADFAHGVGAFGFKLGSPARGERIAKYNRLLAIEKER